MIGVKKSVQIMKNLELSSDDLPEAESDSDCDVCSENEICSLFSSKCNLITENTVSSCNYVMHMSCTLENTPTIIIGLSNNTSEVYDLNNNSLAKLHTFEVTDNVIGVKVSTDNNNLFYIGTSNCEITLWDIRTPKKAVSILKDVTVENGYFKPLNCFDVCPSNRLLAAGTDVYEGDAFILFWDIRNVKMLGGYWESHTDDITQIKFHPKVANKLISGSTDGLINVYDLSLSKEEDALVDSLNTGSSVDQLHWFSRGSTDAICCVLHTNDVQLWNADGVSPHACFQREELSKQIKRKATDYTYVANTHINSDSNIFLLIGSTFQDGRCLRMLGVHNNLLEPSCNFSENKQIVRSSSYNEHTNILVTGGEKGLLNVWKIERTIS